MYIASIQNTDVYYTYRAFELVDRDSKPYIYCILAFSDDENDENVWNISNMRLWIST